MIVDYPYWFAAPYWFTVHTLAIAVARPNKPLLLSCDFLADKAAEGDDDDDEAVFKLAFGADADATASGLAVVSNVPPLKNDDAGAQLGGAVAVERGGKDVLGGLDDEAADDANGVDVGLAAGDDDAGVGLLLLSLLGCGVLGCGGGGEGLSLLEFCSC